MGFILFQSASMMEESQIKRFQEMDTTSRGKTLPNNERNVQDGSKTRSESLVLVCTQSL